jgi:tetratricopeptide (TPR) repeat protein
LVKWRAASEGGARAPSRLGLLLVAFALAAPPALAKDPPPPPETTPSDADMGRAKELFENGQTLFDEGRYEDAITAWEESYRLSGAPDLLWNLSSAWERLGDYGSALAALNRYRALAPASERETLDRRMRALEERIARKQQETPPPAAAPPVTPPPAATPTPPSPTPVPSAKKRPFPVGPVVVGAVGVGGLAFGTVEALQASGAVAALRDSCVSTDAGLVCPEGAKADADARANAATLSLVGFGVGGLLTAGGVVWLVVDRAHDVSLGPGPGLTGLSLTGTF